MNAASAENIAASTENIAASTENIAASTENITASTENIAASTENIAASTEEKIVLEKASLRGPGGLEAVWHYRPLRVQVLKMKLFHLFNSLYP